MDNRNLFICWLSSFGLMEKSTLDVKGGILPLFEGDNLPSSEEIGSCKIYDRDSALNFIRAYKLASDLDNGSDHTSAFYEKELSSGELELLEELRNDKATESPGIEKALNNFLKNEMSYSAKGNDSEKVPDVEGLDPIAIVERNLEFVIEQNEVLLEKIARYERSGAVDKDNLIQKIGRSYSRLYSFCQRINGEFSMDLNEINPDYNIVINYVKVPDELIDGPYDVSDGKVFVSEACVEPFDRYLVFCKYWEEQFMDVEDKNENQKLRRSKLNEFFEFMGLGTYSESRYKRDKITDFFRDNFDYNLITGFKEKKE